MLGLGTSQSPAMHSGDRASFDPPPDFRRRFHFLRKSLRAALSAQLVGGEVAQPVARESSAVEPTRGRWFLASGGGPGRGWAGASRRGRAAGRARESPPGEPRSPGPRPRRPVVRLEAGPEPQGADPAASLRGCRRARRT